MANKMTKRDYFNLLLTLDEVQANDALVTFINHELDLLAKKNTGEKKLTAVQVENQSIKDAIFNAMEANRMYTITEMIKEIPECADLTNQRVAALVRQMMPDRIERIMDKRKAFFRKIQ